MKKKNKKILIWSIVIIAVIGVVFYLGVMQSEFPNKLDSFTWKGIEFGLYSDYPSLGTTSTGGCVETLSSTHDDTTISQSLGTCGNPHTELETSNLSLNFREINTVNINIAGNLESQCYEGTQGANAGLTITLTSYSVSGENNLDVLNLAEGCGSQYSVGNIEIYKDGDQWKAKEGTNIQNVSIDESKNYELIFYSTTTGACGNTKYGGDKTAALASCKVAYTLNDITVNKKAVVQYTPTGTTNGSTTSSTITQETENTQTIPSQTSSGTTSNAIVSGFDITKHYTAIAIIVVSILLIFMFILIARRFRR